MVFEQSLINGSPHLGECVALMILMRVCGVASRGYLVCHPSTTDDIMTTLDSKARDTRTDARTSRQLARFPCRITPSIGGGKA